MALPVLSDVRTYLRVETTAADTDLTAILARAGALVRQFLDRPIEATAKTYTLYADGAGSRQPITRLFIPDAPVKTAAPDAPEITDEEGTLVDAATYRINAETGEVRCLAGYAFAIWPYTVEATVGLAVASDYSTRAEQLISAAILDCCADFYQNRNPRAQAEGVGGGVYVQWSALTELPARTKGMLMTLRRPGCV